MEAGKILLKNKQRVLSDWEARVREVIPEARDMSRVFLVDHIPSFLNEMIKKLIQLEGPAHTADVLAKEHGEVRFKMDEYGLIQIIQEYKLLCEVIMGVFDAEPMVSLKERKIVYDFIFNGIQQAISQYSQLQLQNLRRSEDLFNTLSVAVPEITWVADEEGKASYFNRRWYDYTGFSEEESLGRGWLKAIHPEDQDKWFLARLRYLESGEAICYEKRLRSGDGQMKWFLTRALPVRDEEGRIFRWVGSCTEIEAQKETMENLLRERELRARFGNALTHDLRNPLSVARLLAQRARRKLDNPQVLEESLEKIVSSIDRADSMITDLLDVGRYQAGHGIDLKKGSCPISRLTRQAGEELGEINGRPLELDVEDGIFIEADCEGLRRVIDNLVSNAFKYGDKERAVSLSLKRLHRRVLLSVHNFGSALSEEEKRELFVMFGRSKSARKSGTEGWGIGLTIVKGIVEAHGGKISVESTYEDGTTFLVELPA